MHETEGDMKKERVSLTIDPDLLAKAQDLAKSEERSFSSMVSILIREAMDRKEKAA